MSLIQLTRYALTLSPKAAFTKGLRHIGRSISARITDVRMQGDCTFAEIGAAGLKGRLAAISAATFALREQEIVAEAGMIVDHRFDLLGSGRLRVEYGMTCRGFAGVVFPPFAPPKDAVALISPGNRERSRKIRGMIGEGYGPIDWQIDFRSGYRWREDLWHGRVVYGHQRGVDVKIPWELGRLQHLPRLALAWVLTRDGHYLDEFRNQTLDFIAANPPGFGVNWACPMDVGIRAANLCLAWDLFRASGADFDREFEQELAAALLAHGRHVAANLEWHETLRANHYLANVAGLLFIGTYLDAPEAEKWRDWAAGELSLEAMRQFWPDGAGFEASTSYHRLAAEMAVFGIAVALGAGVGDWGRIHCERIARMAEFTIDSTKPDGRIVQIGDNDSGRFFNLLPIFDNNVLEVDLDHRSLVAAIDGLVDRDDLARFYDPDLAGIGAIVAGLAGGRRLAGGRPWKSGSIIVAQGEGQGETPCETVIRLPDASVLADIRTAAYPDFGLYIWKGSRFFLSVRCGPVGQNGNGAHAHNDQLAIELQVDGRDWLADPGSYVYTAAPDIRDRYRSVASHAAPCREMGEPARLDLGMFRLDDRAEAQCLRFDAEVFVGLHHGFAAPTLRRIEIDRAGGRIIVADSGQPLSRVVSGPDEARTMLGSDLPFSPGYGRLADGETPHAS